MGNTAYIRNGNGMLSFIGIIVTALISSLCLATVPAAEAPYKLCMVYTRARSLYTCINHHFSVQVMLELMIHLGLIVTLGVGIHLDAFGLATAAVRAMEVAVSMLLGLIVVVELLTSVLPIPICQMKWEVSCLC